MPSLLPPDPFGNVVGLDSRILDLESRGPGDTGDQPVTVTGSFPGTVTTGASTSWICPGETQFQMASLTASAAGSTATKVEIRRNGTEVQTITLGASNTSGRVPCAVGAVRGDTLDMNITQGDHTDLSVQLTGTSLDPQHGALIGSGGIGGDGTGPTVLIASSNANQESKDRADLVVTGVDDGGAINDFANNNLDKGTILLSEGTFSIDPGTPIEVWYGALIGAGWARDGGTRLVASSNTAGHLVELQDDGQVISDIYLDANGRSADIDAIQLGTASKHQLVRNCLIHDFHGVGIEMFGADENMILGNTISATFTGISWTSAYRNLIANNHIENSDGIGGTVRGIYSSSSSGGDNMIVNNLFGDDLDYAIELYADDSSLITSNLFREINTNCVVLQSGCSDIFCVGNMMKGSTVAAASCISDSGTGTQLTYPGGAAGDNFA